MKILCEVIKIVEIPVALLMGWVAMNLVSNSFIHNLLSIK